MTAGNPGALVPVTTCGVVGARGKACPAQPLNPTDAEPAILHTCHHSTAACDYSNRNADPAHVSSMIGDAGVNLTVFEHVHSRQFCVADAHLTL